uniref:hypothetical protein n=1 Tax=Clostridium sp. NkU-1 TaxID=1095009 RepID=UPI0006CF795F
MYVRDEEEFGQAVRDGKDRIELEGDLAAKVKKLYKINITLWSFCLVCLAVASSLLCRCP